jgi:L-aminopeptidase/D-esterase-like protein
MITIELTTENLEQLRQGALEFGRCMLITETSDGDTVYVAATNHKRRGRAAQGAPRKMTAEETAAMQATAATAAAEAGRTAMHDHQTEKQQSGEPAPWQAKGSR